MNVEIAERLAKRRREAGFSQEVLAEKLGVTRQAVSKWERSESSPDTDNLIALARLYKVSLDELLNIDPAIEDDMAFEATDRAQARTAATSQSDESGHSYSESASDSVADGADETGRADKSDRTSNDTAGVSFYEDDSYVRINLHDGVHVKDAKTGEEVHVGWTGINIKNKDGESGRYKNWENWSSNYDANRKDNGFKVEINGQACDKHSFSIWYKFPFPLVVILAYLLMGFFAPPLSMPVGPIPAWSYGCFLIALIPLYYMLIAAFEKREPIPFLQGFWPFACLVAFLWLSIMMGIPHPAWVLFLTIPIVEWILESILKSRRKAQRAYKSYEVRDVHEGHETYGDQEAVTDTTPVTSDE